MPPPHIAIIGCGISGPVTALLLKQRGYEVTLFERVANPEPVGAGFLLQPAGLYVLQQINLANKMVALGAMVHRLHGKNHRGESVVDLAYRDLHPDHFGLGVHRAALYGLLYDACQEADVNLITGCHITQYTQNATKVTLVDENSQPYTGFDGCIVATGTHSNLRDQAKQIRYSSKLYPWGALWSIVPLEGFDCDNELRQRFHGTHKMTGVLPTGKTHLQSPENLFSFFWSMPISEEESWPHASLDDWRAEVIRLWPEITPLIEKITDKSQLSFATYRDVRMSQWHEGRVLFIGDCAHGMSPQLGQGANLGLTDALTVSEALTETPDDTVNAFKNYTTLRRSQLRYYQWASSFVTPWFQSHSKTMGVLRDSLHGAMCHMPVLRRHMLLTLACMKTGLFSCYDLKRFESLRELVRSV